MVKYVQLAIYDIPRGKKNEVLSRLHMDFHVKFKDEISIFI